jgi:hypothetical protein
LFAKVACCIHSLGWTRAAQAQRSF